MAKKKQRVELLRRTVNAGELLANNLKGLECLGSCTLVSGERKTYVELYKLPGRRDYGVIMTNPLCLQIQPRVWHLNRELSPVAHPLNERLRNSPSDERGIIRIRVLPVKQERVELERKVLRKCRRNKRTGKPKR